MWCVYCRLSYNVTFIIFYKKTHEGVLAKNYGVSMGEMGFTATGYDNYLENSVWKISMHELGNYVYGDVSVRVQILSMCLCACRR